MSQNARLDPSLITEGLRSPPKPQRAPRVSSGALLGRIGVGQKLALTAGLFALPITVLLYLTASGRQQDINFVQRELSGAQQIEAYGQLQTSVTDFIGAKLGGDQAKMASAGTAADQALATLQSDMAARGLALSSATFEDVTQKWKLLEEAGAGPQGTFAVSMFNTFTSDAMLPGLETLLTESNLLLDSTPSSYFAVQGALVHLPEVQARLSTLALLAQSINQIQNMPALSNLLLPQYRDEAIRAGVALDAAFSAVARAEAQDPSLKATLGKAMAGLDEVRQTLSNGAGDNISVASERLDPTTLQKAALKISAAVGVGNTEVKRLLGARVGAERRGMALELLSVALLTVLAGLLLLAVARAITRPLTRLAQSARALEQGDLSVSVPVTTRDELGVVGLAFNAATAKLRVNQEQTEAERQAAQRLQANVGEFLDVTMQIADGDLTARGRVSEDVLGNVVDSINLMTEELAAVLSDVQRASTSVTGGSQSMLESTEQIRQGTLVTTLETGRVTRQAQEMTAAIRQMSAIAQASADSAQRALVASETGQQAVSSTLKGMEAIRQSSQGVAVRVRSLTQRSEQIEEIVDSISHIASQVNLLSLHASIEAAGAGEAGKRFAVVAEEIRELADLSTDATARIAELIAKVQGDVQGVAQDMQVNSAQVEQGYVVAGQAGEALREIAELAGVTAHFASNISDAAREQMQEVQGMSGAVTQIADVARESQRSAETGREVAEQLQQLAQRLSGSLARFRLPG
ncbi:methyl-accepting chemotaxis protein [Deinococcus radiopugnans]|uniref:Methyl-accepting chemotaxis protein n=1 Tax=Deinococcus radiopugnans ATCC 19172 TaxID=585398 RepID=A0A5C4YBR9_9DEIO|nr:methyl-accepting chemotaxis protein [Deinococcus radiopugnans]MBB6015452.1 twitching motility protein PilJ [Deinococcus radiopugnans ATCC 19172]QLG13045.1 methyl-accepting chemotaxis protein [Deinococcus sp. D7000]TNM72864.1 methyl-accepting chemotaxis protein [Deinococcus radiopugnans ATCC 19172]